MLERLGALFERHARASLHFSGGKDSLACLLLLEPWWDRVVVTWANTGDAFPETMAMVERVRAAVPHFHEARSYVRPFTEIAGWPVEVLPSRHAAPAPPGRHPMQLRSACCLQNVAGPLVLADRESGATLAIVGRRLADSGGAPELEPGTVEHGIEYAMPLWGWSDSDVWAFLEAQGVDLPPHYRLAPDTTSLECMHCTAWWRDGAPGRLRVLGARYPDAHREVLRRLRIIRESVATGLGALDAALAGEGEARPSTGGSGDTRLTPLDGVSGVAG